LRLFIDFALQEIKNGLYAFRGKNKIYQGDIAEQCSTQCLWHTIKAGEDDMLKGFGKWITTLSQKKEIKIEATN